MQGEEGHWVYRLRAREGQRGSKRRRTAGGQSRFQRAFGRSRDMLARLGLHRTLESHTGCVNTIVWNETGDKLVSGSDDKHVKIWDMNTYELSHSFHTGHSANIFCAKFLPNTDERQIVSCAADAQVRWTDLPTNTITPFFCNSDRVKKICTEQGSPFIFYSCSEDSTIRRYDLRLKHDCESDVDCEAAIDIDLRQGDGCYSGRSVHVNSFAISDRDPNFLVVGGSDPVLRTYDRRMFSGSDSHLRGCVHRFRPAQLKEKPRLHITGVTLSFDGREALASYGGDHIYLFDVSGSSIDGSETSTCFQSPTSVNIEETEPSNQERHEISTAPAVTENDADSENEEIEHPREESSIPQREVPVITAYEKVYQGHLNVQTVKEINFLGPTSDFVASGSDDGRIFIWDKRSGRLVQILKGDSDVVNCVRGHPLGYPVIASSGIENDIKVWLPTEEANLLEHAEEITAENSRLLAEGGAPMQISRRMMRNLVHLMLQRGAVQFESGEDDEGVSECTQS